MGRQGREKQFAKMTADKKDGRQRTEDGRRRTEVRKREEGRRKTDDGGLRSE